MNRLARQLNLPFLGPLKIFTYILQKGSFTTTSRRLQQTFTTQSSTMEPSKSVALNQKLQMSESEKKQLWKMPRFRQKDIFKLCTYTKTYKQITEGHDTFHYCDYTFDVYADHYLLECPANRIYRSKFYTGNIHKVKSDCYSTGPSKAWPPNSCTTYHEISSNTV